jgi:hypothetical protein
MLHIKNEDLVKGHFPVPLGVINGDLEIFDATKIIDFTNGPTEVKGDIYAGDCYSLRTLQGFPKKVTGTNIDFGNCRNLRSIKEIFKCDFKGTVYSDGCDKLPAE